MTTTPTAYDLTRLWLAARVRGLWDLASEDLKRACREFDRLVIEHGRGRMALALSDAGLQPTIDSDTAPKTAEIASSGPYYC